MVIFSAALERLKRILPDARRVQPSGEAWIRFPGDRLAGFLETEVAPHIRDLVAQPGFRELVLRPFESLSLHSDSSEWRQINVLKGAIADANVALKHFVFSESDLLNRHYQSAVRNHYRLRGWIRDSAELSWVHGRLAGVDNRLDTEWVSLEDFYGPVWGTRVWIGENKSLTAGEFVIDMNHRLTHVGNFVARCLMVRADRELSIVEEVGGELTATLNAAESQATRPWQAPLSVAKNHLAALRRQLLETEEARLIDAAISLVHVYADFGGESTELAWIPVEDVHRRRHQGRLRHNLTSTRSNDTAWRIFRAISIVDRWEESRSAAESELAEAIQSRGLVIDLGRQKSYWEGKPIDVDWRNRQKQWRLLVALARSQGRANVSEDAVYGDELPEDSAFAVLKNRLSQVVPASLRARIVPGGEKKTYRLDLPSSSVFVVG